MEAGKRCNSQSFVNFCRKRHTDPIQVTTEMGKEFLTEYFKTGVVYSSVNSACSVLPNIIKPVCNVLSLVWTLLNGVFNIRPALPKYVTTWDVTKVFPFIKSKPTLTNWDLKTLSHRIAILSCLTTGEKDKTVKCLNLDYIKISSDKVVSLMPETLKTTNQARHKSSFTAYRTIHLKQYIKMTAPFPSTGYKPTTTELCTTT